MEIIYLMKDFRTLVDAVSIVISFTFYILYKNVNISRQEIILVTWNYFGASTFWESFIPDFYTNWLNLFTLSFIALSNSTTVTRRTFLEIFLEA